MFRIKICGIRTLEEARQTVEAGAEALGLNFYAGSRRRVEREAAIEIAEGVRGQAEIVALLVNHPLDQIQQIARQIRPDWIQLHGDETCGQAREIHEATGCRILMACRGGILPEKFRLVDPEKGPWEADAVLVDSLQPGSYGGTGVTADWQSLAGWRQSIGLHHLVLAGGLRPENVAEAITAVRPTAVDVAGGVEGSDGKKDPQRVARFVQAARSAFAAETSEDD